MSTELEQKLSGRLPRSPSFPENDTKVRLGGNDVVEEMEVKSLSDRSREVREAKLEAEGTWPVSELKGKLRVLSVVAKVGELNMSEIEIVKFWL